jgi:hypothetical protein
LQHNTKEVNLCENKTSIGPFLVFGFAAKVLGAEAICLYRNQSSSTQYKICVCVVYLGYPYHYHNQACRPDMTYIFMKEYPVLAGCYWVKKSKSPLLRRHAARKRFLEELLAADVSCTALCHL